MVASHEEVEPDELGADLPGYGISGGGERSFDTLK
jgi:hypothetical protein